MKKERFVPVDCISKIEGSNSIVYYSDKIAIGYIGKQINHTFYYSFSTKEELMVYITKFTEKVNADLQAKIERNIVEKKAMKELCAKDFFKIGDVIINSWGYEQTNIDFYQVINVTSKTIEVHEINQSLTSKSTGNSMSGYVVPIKDSFILDNNERLIRKLRIKPGYNGDGVRICNPKSYYYFCIWDGKPQYTSWYA